MRINRRKKMGYSQVANEMTQRPFENNINMAPMTNQIKDWRLDFIVVVFMRLTMAQSSADEMIFHFTFVKK